MRADAHKKTSKPTAFLKHETKQIQILAKSNDIYAYDKKFVLFFCFIIVLCRFHNLICLCFGTKSSVFVQLFYCCSKCSEAEKAQNIIKAKYELC